MPPKKQNLIDKIVKKDYNNELEKLLEEKRFDENVKSNLLSILYKIEAAYKDVETVKKDIEKKDEYIEQLLEIIKKDCDSIKIVKITDKDSGIPSKSTYIINKNKKEIIAYPIDRKILYALAKISKKDKIINEKHFIIDETLSSLINVGNNINFVEPLRDFNGYSWTIIPQEFESIDHNLIYQNLRMLVGEKFLNRWIKNNEFIIDYFELFKERLEKQYGTELKDKIIKALSGISILLDIKFNESKILKYNNMKSDIEQELRKMQNKGKYLESITARKNESTKIIRVYDTIMNDKKLLQKEYNTRNSRLPLDKKIFSMKVLAKMMKRSVKNILMR